MQMQIYLCFRQDMKGLECLPLEAIACGTRVLSSDASSLPEVLGDTANIFENKIKMVLRKRFYYV